MIKLQWISRKKKHRNNANYRNDWRCFQFEYIIDIQVAMFSTKNRVNRMWQNKSVALVEIHNIRQQMDQVKERLLTSSYGSVQNFVYCTLDYAYSWSSARVIVMHHFVGCSNVHTVKSTVQKMNTPVLIPFRTWVHTIFSCLWTVLPFLTWLYTRFLTLHDAETSVLWKT